MKKTRIAAIAVTSALSLALFGWGTVAGAGDEVMGVMAAEDAAAIVVTDQPEAKGIVVIDRVLAPADGFVVVHQSDGGMPGARLGYTPVSEGENRNVKVKLDPKVALTPELLAAVHIDRGTRGVLEFDMDNIARSADRPFFVGGKEVAAAFKAAEFGVTAEMGEVVIEAADQPLGSTLSIAKATAPAASFVVVHKAKADGMPGERVGFARIEAGENTDVEVTLTKKLAGTTKLLAAVHADADENGDLDFDMDDPVGSPDQPYFVDGMEAAVAFTVGPFGVKTDDASLEATDQVGAEGTLTIAEVDAPADAWIVVHKDAGGVPGERVGLKRVSRGTSSDVEVELTEEMLPESLIVALHADRGGDGVFDFDMSDKLGSPDQPFFVDGAEVAVVVKVREFGYSTPVGTAAISVSDQLVRNAVLRVDRALAPEGAWIVVHLDADGMPGARVGLVHIPSGQVLGALVQLDASQMLTDQLFVAVHADRGEAGVFEFDMMDKVNSPDQPYFVGGAEVATGVSIR